ELLAQFFVEKGVIKDRIHLIDYRGIALDIQAMSFLDADFSLNQIIKKRFARRSAKLKKLQALFVFLIELLQRDHVIIDPREHCGGRSRAADADRAQSRHERYEEKPFVIHI